MLNLYCDESCHLENDGESVMLIGGISCPDYVRNIVYKEIKGKFQILKLPFMKIL